MYYIHLKLEKIRINFNLVVSCSKNYVSATKEQVY